MDILIGCDPEVFVRSNNSLQFQCAHNLVPGTKEKPFRVPGGAVQVDGMALEFNIDPAKNRDEFLGNVKKVYHELANMAHPLELVPVPTANFDADIFAAAPDKAKELGCEPDYNAYTGEKNPRPQGDRPFRTASGHIHIGWTEGADPFDPGHFADCRDVVKMMDVILGIQSLKYDKDQQRRQLYGAAGAFRPKSYGVEYRVLSNRWLVSDELIQWAYDATYRGMELMFSGIKRPIDDYMIKDMIAGYSDTYGTRALNAWRKANDVPAPPKVKAA